MIGLSALAPGRLWQTPSRHTQDVAAWWGSDCFPYPMWLTNQKHCSWPLGEPYSYGGTEPPYMLRGLLGSRSNMVDPSHPSLQGPLGESWTHDGTKSPGPLEEP
ncbi:hypothetical protein Scep_028350 [Stephania cephalantha]|uniref:Uncharacterized protein n=1 Tax=Stephania cephalantha TaxID=152367 RepID=A0AAP0EDM2_9MAGN